MTHGQNTTKQTWECLDSLHGFVANTHKLWDDCATVQERHAEDNNNIKQCDNLYIGEASKFDVQACCVKSKMVALRT